MSTQQQTLSWLAELPEDSSAWRELHDDARLLRDIAAAEDDVRNGLERPLAEARELLELKWIQRRSKSPDRLGAERSPRDRRLIELDLGEG